MKSTDKEFQDAVMQEIPLVFTDIIDFNRLYNDGEFSIQDIIYLWGIVQRTQVNHPLFYENVNDINKAIEKLSLQDIDEAIQLFDKDKWFNTYQYVKEHKDAIRHMKSLLSTIDVLLTACSIRDNRIKAMIESGEDIDLIGNMPGHLIEKIAESAVCYSQLIDNVQLLEPIRPYIHLMTYICDTKSEDFNKVGFVYSTINEIFEQEDLLNTFAENNINGVASFFQKNKNLKENEKNPLEEEK